MPRRAQQADRDELITPQVCPLGVGGKYRVSPAALSRYRNASVPEVIEAQFATPASGNSSNSVSGLIVPEPALQLEVR